MAYQDIYTALLDTYYRSIKTAICDDDDIRDFNDFLAKHDLKTRGRYVDNEFVLVRDRSDEPTENDIKEFISEILLAPVYDDADLYRTDLGLINETLNYYKCPFAVLHLHKGWKFVKVIE